MPRKSSSGKNIKVRPITQAELRYEAEIEMDGTLEDIETIHASSFLGNARKGPGAVSEGGSDGA